MAFQELFVTLQHPRKDDGETLCCCRRNGRGIEPRPFLPKKGLRLTLSVVCLAELKGSCYCLSNIGTLVWDWGVLYILRQSVSKYENVFSGTNPYDV